MYSYILFWFCPSFYLFYVFLFLCFFLAQASVSAIVSAPLVLVSELVHVGFLCMQVWLQYMRCGGGGV